MMIWDGKGSRRAAVLMLRIIPGTHDSILREPHVQFLAKEAQSSFQ